MTERANLLASIANTIKDYRAGEIAEPTPEHADRWIRQFGEDVQVPMLRELDHVFKQTYFPKVEVERRLRALVNQPPDRSVQPPCAFWERAHIFSIQRNGESQATLRGLLGGFLHYECGVNIDDVNAEGQIFVYLDDALFSGRRLVQDLAAWMPNAPSTSVVYVCVIASHSYGEFWCQQTRIPAISSEHGKKVNLQFWRFKGFENRRAYRDRAEVLWPVAVPDNPDVVEYLSSEGHSLEGFQPRAVSRNPIPPFATESGRQLLEAEFLRAGTRIINSHNDVSPALKPLGFSSFEPGFGSLVSFYRNCPNNTPLALWWSLGGWYPLLPRKPYEREW